MSERKINGLDMQQLKQKYLPKKSISVVLDDRHDEGNGEDDATDDADERERKRSWERSGRRRMKGKRTLRTLTENSNLLIRHMLLSSK